MSALGTTALWLVFVAASVFGHVALKLGTAAIDGETEGVYWARIVGSPWTLSGVLAWVVAGLVWVLILRDSPLFESFSISTLRYALVVLAAAVFLRESIERHQIVGIVLVTAGVFLIKGKP